MKEKMTTDSHSRDCRGSERGHNRKEKEDAKKNCMRKKLTDAEFWKEAVRSVSSFINWRG